MLSTLQQVWLILPHIRVEVLAKAIRLSMLSGVHLQAPPKIGGVLHRIG
jgi:hypothetical protein